MATWHCQPTLISPHTKILPSDISLVKSVSWYFQWGKSNSKQTVEPIHRKSLDHPWPNNILRNTKKSPYQNTFLWKIPCQVYELVLSMGKIKLKAVVGTQLLSMGNIKVKTNIDTHPEQKFGASMANWHCPATLKSPSTKILLMTNPLSSI